MRLYRLGTFPALATAWIWLGGPLSGQFLYIANPGSNSLSGYAVNTSTGVLAPIAGSPFAVAGSPFSVAIHPSGRFAYATGFSDNTGINGYTINFPSGALSPLSGSPFAAVGGNIVIAIQPSGRFAYVTNGFGGSVSIYTVDSQTGALSFSGSSAVTPLTRRDLVIHPSGKFVYMTQECVPTGNICDANAPSTVQGYAADPNTGALTPIAGSPFAAGPGARTLAVDPTGRFLYVGNGLDISGYRVDPSTGALTSLPGPPFAPGSSSPMAIAIAPQGGFVYVPRGDGMIWGYRMDPVSGALAPISGSPWGNGQLSLALSVDCTSKFLYAANYYSASVSAFAINSQTGALTSIAGSPFPVGNSPLAVAEACPAALGIGNVSASPDVLWPLNHDLVDVAVDYTVNSAISATCTLSVSSSEPGPGQWEVVDAHHVRLRAERNGNASGRIYTIEIDCTNGQATAAAIVTVIVPHDQGR